MLVLEQAPRVGGCIRSERTPEGYLIEHGPNSLLNLNPEVDRLCQELGLDHDRVDQQPASRRRYLVRGRALVAAMPTNRAYLDAVRATASSAQESHCA